MHIDILLPLMPMIYLLILAVHLLAIAKIMRPRGVRAVVAQSVLLNTSWSSAAVRDGGRRT